MNTLKNMRISVLTTIFCALVFGPVVLADDTEIFFGQSEDSFDNNPNILFILDTSGSMGEKDGGRTTRMDRMKVAMRALLAQSSSFNVGLMGFSGENHGGSIRYPIGDLEAEDEGFCPDGVCADVRIIASPRSGDDDSQQNDDTNIITLDNDFLTIPGIYTEATDDSTETIEAGPRIITRVTHVEEVVAEYEDGPVSFPRKIEGNSQWFYNGTPGSTDDHYGYRFRVKIPRNAIVTSAYLTFTETDRAHQFGNMSTRVKLEYSSEPEELPTATNGLTPLSERLITATRGVQWDNIHPDTTTLDAPNPSADDSGSAIPISTLDGNKAYSPDLSEIMNNITALPNWRWGKYMNFILDPSEEYTPSGSDTRSFYGTNTDNRNLRPYLTFSFTNRASTDVQTTNIEATQFLDEITEQNTNIVSRNLNNSVSRLMYAADTHFPRKVGLLFEDIDIPKDAVIQSALLIMRGSRESDQSSEDPLVNWHDDAVTVAQARVDGTITDGEPYGSQATQPDEEQDRLREEQEQEQLEQQQQIEEQRAQDLANQQAIEEQRAREQAEQLAQQQAQEEELARQQAEQQALVEAQQQAAEEEQSSTTEDPDVLLDGTTDVPATAAALGGLPTDLELSMNISAEDTGFPLPYDNDPLDTRTYTSTFVPWTNIEVESGKTITSPDLTSVISAVINNNSWEEGQKLSLKLEAPAAYDNVIENSALIDTAKGREAPYLRITWAPVQTAADVEKGTQTTALRFSDLHVPPGAKIKTARLVFNAEKAAIEPLTLEVAAEVTSNPEFLNADENDIGRRIRTRDKVDWVVEPWDIPEQTYYSDDISSVVQEIIDLPDWCGGNPINILLSKKSGDDSRHAVSADTSVVSAPSLEVTYSPDDVPSGAYCSTDVVVSSTSAENDDAVEDTSTGEVSTNTPTLHNHNPVTGAKNLIGLKFQSLPLPADAKIVSADLIMSNAAATTENQSYEIKISDNTSPEDMTQENKISSQNRNMSETVTHIHRNLGEGETMNVNVTSLIQRRVSSSEWESGGPAFLTVKALSDGEHSFYAYDAGESLAPQLVIYYQSERDTSGTLYRENLSNIVDSLVARGGTPIVGTLYEASQYFTGQPIDYGLKRGRQVSNDRFHRVSHPLSYFDGEVNTPSGCSEFNPNHWRCIRETIEKLQGRTPTYISPMASECQQNHIVILSDGAAWTNSAENKIRNLTGVSNCVGNNQFERCGAELANWLNDTDHNPSLPGTQNVSVHSIGFNLSNPTFLKTLASEGGGQFYSAESSGQLLTVFQNIFANVSKTDVSFVAPSATVSQANRLKNRDDIYFALFRPESTARWSGNLKRYRLGAPGEDETADLLDVNDNKAVDDSTGRFYDSAKSYWSDVIDGDNVELGGAAAELQTDGASHFNRKVYTFTDIDTDLSNTSVNELLPRNPHLLREWLVLPPTLADDRDYTDTLINWAHGQDVLDSDGDSDFNEVRSQIGDPMHSQPLLVNYIGGRSVVHLATNEGFLHAIDHETGKENYAFIPKELLKNLRRNYDNLATSNRPYGLDGGMTTWIQDENGDGVVDPSEDKAYLYIGMRRGGNLYYALDITNPDKPKYMWSIAGGAVADGNIATQAKGDFIQLGETWSKPTKAKIYDNSEIRDVLIFGAGYGSNQDPKEEVDDATVDSTIDTRQTRATDTVGLGFFIVDAITGERLWGADLTNASYSSDMMYSVPSELRVVDIDFDGLADQIYFGDMGGQVWRFDYNNDSALRESINNRMNGGVVAKFAGNTPETARRFYYPPDVSLLSVGGDQQLAISMGSGWRAHPLDTVVEDRFYSFRMTQVYGVPRNEDGDIRYVTVTENTTGMINLDEPNGPGGDAEPIRATNASERGWFLPLKNGEKILSSSITVDNSLVFTSYTPSATTHTCAAAIGNGSVYFVDLGTGNPISDLDNDDSSTETDDENEVLTEADRSRALPASGIPPAPSILFPELGKATAFAGRDKIEEVEIETLKSRTFWQEHIDENL